MRAIMRIGVFCLVLVGVLTPAAYAAQNVVTFTDNSGNEQGFYLQRTTAASVALCQSATGWAALQTLAPNIVSYTDIAVTEGVTYCYRVDAYNAAGESAWSNIAGRTVPFSVPLAPSGLVVN